MNNLEFKNWAIQIRAEVYRKIQEQMYLNGQFPKAIIAGGEYQYVFMDDYKDISRTADGQHFWRGVPLIRSGGHNKISVVWAMEDLVIPQHQAKEEES